MFVSSAALGNLQVDGVYVYSQPPSPLGGGQGINTSTSVLVGSGSWGKTNTLLPFSDTPSLYAACGRLANTTAASSISREGWMSCTLAASLGAQFVGYGIRVTDGTDAAATALVKDSGGTNGVNVTAACTGKDGNDITVSLATGSNSTTGAPTMTATIQRGSYAPEVYPNLTNPTGGGFAAALIAAINNGISGVCPKSQIVVATAQGTSAANFAASSSAQSLAGGTNGDTSITSSIQLGTDGVTGRTGLYAARGSGAQQFILCGNTDSTQYAAQQTFAAAIASLAIMALPSGTSTTAAVTAKQTANCTSQNAAVVKDFLNVTDPVTGSPAQVSPLGEALALIASLPPEASPSNKPAKGCSNFLSTERTGTPYSSAEAQQLETAGILYFTNPIPRGAVYGFAHGENASASVVGVNAFTDNISYTRFTNYLTASIPTILGPYVGELQTTRANDPTRAHAKAALTGWLQGLKDANRIDDYTVTLDLSNNTPTTIGQGVCVALVQVAYMNVVKFFLVNLQGGSAVQVGLGSVPQAA